MDEYHGRGPVGPSAEKVTATVVRTENTDTGGTRVVLEIHREAASTPEP
ncbi:hypothetical protein AB0M43_15685 [Longispora sp. NPDC051575]